MDLAKNPSWSGENSGESHYNVAGTVLSRTSTSFGNVTRSAYQVVCDQDVDLTDIRLAFVNDGLAESGEVRPIYLTTSMCATSRQEKCSGRREPTAILSVFAVRLDGRADDTDTAFPTGSYLVSDGVVPGIGRGFTLHTDGYFQFGAVSDTGVESLSNSRSGPEVNVRWLPDTTTGLGAFGGTATVREEAGLVLRLERTSGLDAASITFQVFQSTTQFEPGQIPSNVSQDPVTVVFEDGQLATNLVIPVEDNSVPDSGFFEIRTIDSSDNISDFVNLITAQLVDED